MNASKGDPLTTPKCSWSIPLFAATSLVRSTLKQFIKARRASLGAGWRCGVLNSDSMSCGDNVEDYSTSSRPVPLGLGTPVGGRRDTINM